MIEERGRVVAIDNSGLWVETVQRSGCHGCAAKSGCGTGLLGDFWASASRVHVPASERERNEICLHDTVVIGIGENTLALSALIVYLVPLLTMVLLAVAGEAVTASEPGAMAGAVLGLAIGALAVRYYGRLNAHNPAMAPQLLRVESGTPCVLTGPVALEAAQPLAKSSYPDPSQ
jgi:sigma-E factor negative regulatory protein RseC